LQAGVSVSIAPDWTPSGTDSVLDEVRYAEQLVEARWPGLLRPVDYVAMVTRVPAAQLGAAGEVGTLQVGLHADLLLVDGDPMVPYRSVIEARPEDIRLVLIGGVPSYGDPELLGAMPDTPDSCHEVLACGIARNACWSDAPDGPAGVVPPAARTGAKKSKTAPVRRRRATVPMVDLDMTHPSRSDPGPEGDPNRYRLPMASRTGQSASWSTAWLR